jgi:hypothetical protein
MLLKVAAILNRKSAGSSNGSWAARAGHHLIMGLIVGFIVVALLMAIFSLTEVAL